MPEPSSSDDKEKCRGKRSTLVQGPKAITLL